MHVPALCREPEVPYCKKHALRMLLQRMQNIVVPPRGLYWGAPVHSNYHIRHENKHALPKLPQPSLWIPDS